MGTKSNEHISELMRCKISILDQIRNKDGVSKKTYFSQGKKLLEAADHWIKLLQLKGI
jgi:hypothetical protein